MKITILPSALMMVDIVSPFRFCRQLTSSCMASPFLPLSKLCSRSLLGRSSSCIRMIMMALVISSSRSLLISTGCEVTCMKNIDASHNCGQQGYWCRNPKAFPACPQLPHPERLGNGLCDVSPYSSAGGWCTRTILHRDSLVLHLYFCIYLSLWPVRLRLRWWRLLQKHL
jgi:hypothetical protein